MTRFKSRRRWLLARWMKGRVEQLQALAADLRRRFLPADWARRCEVMATLGEQELTDWKPRPGSSSAELLHWLQPLQPAQRMLLASLLDAPSAGPRTLLEAIKRLQLDWQARLDPLHSHRDYAEQLERLASLLGLAPAARSAYLENEQQLRGALDLLALESMPLRLRSQWATRHQAGVGQCLLWWQGQLLAKAGLAPETTCLLGVNDWPQMPSGWFALGWISCLRHTAGVTSGGDLPAMPEHSEHP